MTRARKELATRPAAELAPPTNAVGTEVASIVAALPKGIYRSTLTICRITIDPATGLEKASTVVTSHCFDFEAKPAALPPAPGKVTP